MSQYILLADPDFETLKYQETALKYFYDGKIHSAQSVAEVKTLLSNYPKPDLLLIDFELMAGNQEELYSHISQNENLFPVIATSGRPLEKYISNYPRLNSWIEKPFTMEDFTHLVKGIVQLPLTSIPSHVSVDIATVLKLKRTQFDLYLRLSGKNYVKLINQGEDFTPEDAQKLMAKGIGQVYISASDTFNFLKLWSEPPPVISGSGTDFTLASIEHVERLSRALGWTKEVLDEAQKIIKHAITVLSKDDKIKEVLEKRLNNRNSEYSAHVSILTYLTTTLCVHLEQIGEAGQMKLAMASLLHDLAVDEEYYLDIDKWNHRAADAQDRSPETVKYRLHPMEAAKFAQSLDAIPPDVDRILLQHHEVIDGSGFPRSLTAARITYLSSFFIMMEDLVEFLGAGVNPTSSLNDFLTWGDAYYTEGHFKKIFPLIKARLIAE